MKKYLLLLILIFSLEILFAKNISVEQAYAIKRNKTAKIVSKLFRTKTRKFSLYLPY